MYRKIVQLFPIVHAGYSGIRLYALANDGTAWRTRHFDDGNFDADGWEQVAELPQTGKHDPLADLGAIKPEVA